MTKPLLSQWIASERKRHGWKAEELSRRLEAAGFEAALTTVRTWEAGRRPAADTITALERMFESAAPAEEDPSVGGLVAALRAQTEAITALVEELRADRRGRERADADAAELAARLQDAASPGDTNGPRSPAVARRGSGR